MKLLRWLLFAVLLPVALLIVYYTSEYFRPYKRYINAQKLSDKQKGKRNGNK